MICYICYGTYCEHRLAFTLMELKFKPIMIVYTNRKEVIGQSLKIQRIKYKEILFAGRSYQSIDALLILGHNLTLEPVLLIRTLTSFIKFSKELFFVFYYHRL